jgi:hypothetical protein
MPQRFGQGIDELLIMCLEHLQQMHNISARYISSRPRYKRLRRAGSDFPPPKALKYNVFVSAKHAPLPGAQKCSVFASARTFR